MKAIAAALLIALAPLMASPAHAQERRGGRGPEHGPERFHTPHWVFDDRYHHNHYYPSIGYSISLLPPGNVAVSFRNGRFFFSAGVWYQPSGPGYVVVRPPVGIVVPMLPPAYSTVWVAGAPYYYANDVYYAAGPGGYIVAAPPIVSSAPPPAGAPVPQAPPAPAPAPAAPTPSGTWYYCESAKGYYPYVLECKEGWRQVPATPPTAR